MKTKIYAARVVNNAVAECYTVEIKRKWYSLEWEHKQTWGYYSYGQKETTRKNAIEHANRLVADTIEYTITN